MNETEWREPTSGDRKADICIAFGGVVVFAAIAGLSAFELVTDGGVIDAVWTVIGLAGLRFWIGQLRRA